MKDPCMNCLIKIMCKDPCDIFVRFLKNHSLNHLENYKMAAKAVRIGELIFDPKYKHIVLRKPLKVQNEKRSM